MKIRASFTLDGVTVEASCDSELHDQKANAVIVRDMAIMLKGAVFSIQAEELRRLDAAMADKAEK